ncbi:MAG: hypothetical protein RL131_702, partial [Bacteroidota bacterium]
VNNARLSTFQLYEAPILQQREKALALIAELVEHTHDDRIRSIHDDLFQQTIPYRRDIMKALQRTILFGSQHELIKKVRFYYNELIEENKKLFNSQLKFGETKEVGSELPVLDVHEDSPVLNGYEILNRYFDELFSSNPKVVAFGEDLGKIGDVNQGFAGLQQKHGSERIFDTGIRELTIIGQGVGLSMRGLRPIAEIQYIDYLLFGLEVLSDDVASLYYRSAGTQIAPLIVRTRGHRLEGIWHSGSPMGLMINSLKGFNVCVPRNMVQAVGFYNALLEGNDPGIVVECLNGYRLKEKLPSDLLNYKLPFGVVETVRVGSDVTVVSYGSTLRIVLDAAKLLAETGIQVEVIDVQTLLPFDLGHDIVESLKKTNRILFVDEDVPGGATSYMFAEVINKQGGYRWLDASPRILCSKEHRPPYGSDGDYFSKPNVEDVLRMITEIMAE